MDVLDSPIWVPSLSDSFFPDNDQTMFLINSHHPPLPDPFHLEIVYPSTNPLASGLPGLGRFPTIHGSFTRPGPTPIHPNLWAWMKQWAQINSMVINPGETGSVPMRVPRKIYPSWPFKQVVNSFCYVLLGYPWSLLKVPFILSLKFLLSLNLITLIPSPFYLITNKDLIQTRFVIQSQK